mmetsp:Transcript_24009/g.72159  ORF Transcript_24009/g.72159 Transcript_24009/m.72159 type:complete len:268 (+) Transcript_24009:1833-2636(+)
MWLLELLIALSISSWSWRHLASRSVSTTTASWSRTRRFVPDWAVSRWRAASCCFWISKNSAKSPLYRVNNTCALHFAASQLACGCLAAQTSMIWSRSRSQIQSPPPSVASAAASSTECESAAFTTPPNIDPRPPFEKGFLGIGTDDGGGPSVSATSSAGLRYDAAISAVSWSSLVSCCLSFKPRQSSGFKILSKDAHSRSSFVQDFGCLNRTRGARSGSKPSGPSFVRSTNNCGSLWKRFMSFQMPRSCLVSLSNVTDATRSSSPRA